MRKITLTLKGGHDDGHIETITCPSDIVSIDISLLREDEDCEAEKPARKIDRQKFDSWGFKKKVVSSAGDYMWDITSPHTRTDIAMVFGDEADDIPKLLAAAPDAMRVLIDLANWRQVPLWYFHTYDLDQILDKAMQIINDAGFGSDIKQG